ncbi:MAG TPA: WYL domain-containing protein, partial [Micromonosporaceae bacterium]
RVIDVEYQNWQQIVQRRLEPYGLVLKAGRWYLVACADGSVRSYRVNQIKALTTRRTEFDWPTGFDLRAYWRDHVADFRARLYTGEALVRMSPAAVERATHCLSTEAVKAIGAGEPEPDGWVRACVPIESHRHAAGELLRVGTGVEVLAPAPLRELMRSIVTELAATYRVGG